MTDVATYGVFDPDAEPKRYRYESLAEHLTQLIDNGVLGANVRLPAELQVASQYGVSLGTTRHALQLLRERGLIVTVRSKGTFVVPAEKRVSGDQ